MSDTMPVAAASASGLVGAVQRGFAALDRIPYWLIALAARVFPAAVFWQSGQTKVAGWHQPLPKRSTHAGLDSMVR